MPRTIILSQMGQNQKALSFLLKSHPELSKPDTQVTKKNKVLFYIWGDLISQSTYY